MFVCCKAFEEAGKACGQVLCPENRPSPIYVIFNWVMNIITLIILIVNASGSNGNGDCSNGGKIKTWTFVMFAICGVHMIFAFYVYARFCKKLEEGRGGAFDTAWKILLYDFGVYFYIWFCVFAIVWLVMGNNWTGGEDVCKGYASIWGVVTCQIVYLVGSPFVCWLSLVTECCREPRHFSHSQANPPRPAPMGRQQPTYQPVAQPAAPPPRQQTYVAQPVHNAPPPAQNPAYQPQHAPQPQYQQHPQQYQQQQQYQQHPQQQQQPNTGQKAVNAVKGMFKK